MSTIDEALYTPPSSPLYETGETLCAVLRQTACLQALCAPLAGTTAAEAVVHGVGDEPTDVNGWTIEQLMRIGCRPFVGPSEEDWLRVVEAESSGLELESYSFDVELRRLVMPLELKTLGRQRLFRWFYAHTAALAAQVYQLGRQTCLTVRSVEGLLSPSFNTKEERVAQGTILHTTFRVKIGDNNT